MYRYYLKKEPIYYETAHNKKGAKCNCLQTYFYLNNNYQQI